MIILALLIPRSRKSGINIEPQTLSMRTKTPKRIELSETTFSNSQLMSVTFLAWLASLDTLVIHRILPMYADSMCYAFLSIFLRQL